MGQQQWMYSSLLQQRTLEKVRKNEITIRLPKISSSEDSEFYTPVPATSAPCNTPVPATSAPCNTPAPTTGAPCNTPAPATGAPCNTPEVCYLPSIPGAAPATCRCSEGGDFKFRYKRYNNNRHDSWRNNTIVSRSMGDVYIRRATNRRHFTKAAALYNAAMTWAPGDQHWRDVIVHRINEAKDKEAKWVSAVRSLFHTTAGRMKDFVRQLLAECRETLGPPPCKYAIIGLGSMAREEMTPYSDFEFAILLEEIAQEQHKEYFRNLTSLLHLKVINLGETILPSMAITSLNNFYSDEEEDNWLYDWKTPRGFAFDGAMPSASKTPLGREAVDGKPAVELIMTPTEMASLQERQAFADEDNVNHLSDILSTVTWVEGDKSLVEDYQERLDLDPSYLVKKALITLFDDASKYQEDIVSASKPGFQYDVKKEIYRFPTLTVSSLGICFESKRNTPREVIDALRDKELISETGAHNLSVAISIATLLRLQTYLAYCRQKEGVTTLPVLHQREKKNGEQDLPHKLPSSALLMRFYQTSIPLQIYLTIFQHRLPGDVSELLGADHDFYCNSDLLRGLIHYRLMHYQEAEPLLRAAYHKKPNRLTHSYLWTLMSLGKYAEALKAAQESTELHQLSLDGCFALAHLYIRIGQFQKAREVCTKALEMLDINFDAELWEILIDLQLADISTNLGEYSKAKELAGLIEQMILKTDEEVIKKKPLAMLNIRFNLGILFSSLGQIVKAHSCHKKTIKMCNMIFGMNVAHHVTASCFRELARIMYRHSDCNTALWYADLSLKMTQNMYSDTYHPDDVIKGLNVLFEILWEQDSNERATLIAEDSLELALKTSGLNKTNLAQVYTNLGKVSSDTGAHSKAIWCHEEALRIDREHYHNKPSGNIAVSLEGLGIAYWKAGDYAMAFQHVQEALHMQEDLFGKDTPRPNTAESLSILGCIKKDMGDHTEAVWYLEKSLSMMKEVFGGRVTDRMVDTIQTLQELRQTSE
ncbi:KLC1 [Branchiostoma lanceolatum]|nr:KLC1 [Branchiostoma lanceolatum]